MLLHELHELHELRKFLTNTEACTTCCRWYWSKKVQRALISLVAPALRLLAAPAVLAFPF